MGATPSVPWRGKRDGGPVGGAASNQGRVEAAPGAAPKAGGTPTSGRTFRGAYPAGGACARNGNGAAWCWEEHLRQRGTVKKAKLGAREPEMTWRYFSIVKFFGGPTRHTKTGHRHAAAKEKPHFSKGDTIRAVVFLTGKPGSTCLARKRTDIYGAFYRLL